MLRNLFAKAVAISMVFASLFCVGLSAQNKPISGTVLDTGGQPVPGAAVMLQSNSRVGTVTDLDGAFTLSVPANSTLVVECLGYKTIAVELGTQPSITITLEEETTVLDETVVIGYGTQKLSDLTGAVASVRSEDLESRSTTDAAAALQGKVPGVQILNTSGAPGSGAEIRVRGYSSNSGSIGPLLIVDGLQVDNIQYLDPSMIESMEVLKDAASAAIYGVRAGNGVVLITTKSGASNQGRSSVSYEFKLTRQALGRKAQVLDAESFIEYKRMTGLPIDADLAANNYDGTDTDWTDVIYGPSFTKQHSLSFQGGNNKGSYFASINYVDDDGIVRGERDTYQRLSAQFNADYKIYDWLTVGTNNSFEKWGRQSVSAGSRTGVMFAALTLDPLTPVYYNSPDEFPNYLLQQYNTDPSLIMKDPTNDKYYAVSKYIEDDTGNPLLQRDRGVSSNGGINIRGTAYLNLNPIKGLTFTSRFGYRIAQSTSHSYSTPYFATKLAKSDYYNISASANTSYYYQWENFANFNRRFGKHDVTAMIGMSFIENYSDNVSANASGPDILDGYAVNFLYLNYVNNNSDTTKGFSNAPGQSASLAYFGRVIYSYDSRYSVQANFRADAGDLSKLSPANRWGYFPSFSFGWTLSNESFIKDNVDRSVLSFLKLRASWGRNGNINVLSGYQWNTTIDYNTQWYQYGVTPEESGNLSYGSKPSGLAQPNLDWETSDQIDIGLDAHFLNNRLTFTADWYNKQTRDLLIGISPVPEVGIGQATVNGGNVLNRGLELALGWRDNIGDFSYGINANFSTLYNELTYLDPSITRITGDNPGANNPALPVCEPGYPLWYTYGYKYLGVNKETGDYIVQDSNDDGAITPEDMTYIGKAIPDYTYGITINLAWKGIDFSLFGTGQAGNQIFNAMYRADTPMRNSLRYYYDNAWTPTNKDALMPDPAKANDWIFWASDAAMFDGSFFKIKQIQLGYTLPSTLTRKAMINNLRFYVSMDDYFTFTKYPGMDPETAGVGSGSTRGFDVGNYPVTKKIVFGAKITF